MGRWYKATAQPEPFTLILGVEPIKVVTLIFTILKGTDRRRTKLDSQWHEVGEIVDQGAKNQNLTGANLSNADLTGTNLSCAYLICANLTDTNLSRANLTDSYLNGANLSGANLSGANLSGVYLIRANLSGANLSGANLSGANLSGANIENACFGYNSGVSESLKNDLIARGAIFQDSLGNRSLVPIQACN